MSDVAPGPGPALARQRETPPPPYDGFMLEPRDLTSAARRILATEQAVYGLILVSGMIVISNNLVGTSLNALVTVAVTLIVFYAAHVYAGTLARLAREGDQASFRESLFESAHESEGMLLAAIVPLAALLLGVFRVVDDDTAIWIALSLDILLLGVLGWLAVARWTTRFVPRLASAVITAAFGGVIALLKSLIHH